MVESDIINGHEGVSVSDLASHGLEVKSENGRELFCDGNDEAENVSARDANQADDFTIAALNIQNEQQLVSESSGGH